MSSFLNVFSSGVGTANTTAAQFGASALPAGGSGLAGASALPAAGAAPSAVPGISTAGKVGLGLGAAAAGLAVFGGVLRGRALAAEAETAKTNAILAEAEGAGIEAQIRRDTQRGTAAAFARFGAAGIDVGGGTPINVTDAIRSEAHEKINVNRRMTSIRRSLFRAQAKALKAKARITPITSTVGAAAGFGAFASQVT